MNPFYQCIAQFSADESPIRANLNYLVWIDPKKPQERTARGETRIYVPVRGFQIQGSFLLDEQEDNREFTFNHRSVNREEVRRYLRRQKEEISAEFSSDQADQRQYRQLAGNCISSLVAFMDTLSTRRVLIAGSPQIGQTVGWMCSVEAIDGAKQR